MTAPWVVSTWQDMAAHTRITDVCIDPEDRLGLEVSFYINVGYDYDIKSGRYSVTELLDIIQTDREHIANLQQELLEAEMRISELEDQ